MGLISLPEEIADALARGQAILTANQRAARVLQGGHDARMAATGAKTWAPAEILAVDAWASTTWRRMLLEGAVDQLLLNASQEHALWLEIVAADKDAAVGLRSADALADMAASAWRLLCGHSGLSRLREVGVSTDTRAFQRWAMAFDRRCRKDGYLSPAQLLPELQAAAARGDLPVPDAGFGLVGFDQILPALGDLFEALRQAGYAIDRLQVETGQATPLLFEAADEAAEIRAAAGWIRRRLEADATAKLAVIVPGLEPKRAEIDRVFREVLAPELEDIAADAGAGPYEFSLGRPLASTAMVVTAVEVLRWAVTGAQPLERVSALLLSPYFGGGRAAEFDAFALRQRRRLRPEITLEEMIAAVEQANGLGDLPGRLRGLRRYALEERVGEAVLLRAHAEWGEAFARMLRAAGWPGAGEIDSMAFQTHRRWENALDELAGLDFDGTRTDAAGAFAALERILRQTIFAAESRDAPVQLLGPLEAGGQNFDGVWFLCAGELEWPEQRVTSSLLPWQLQKELGMPGADAARDRSTARAITARIVASAEEVVFSFAAERADGRQQASPLLRELACKAFTPEPEVARIVQSLERVDEEVALPRLPDRGVRGGAAILAAQAACGFKAFAEHRLWSTELETPEPGMDARDRGSLVHEVMERFWAETETQARLIAMGVAERERVLDDAIDETLAKMANEMGAASAWDMAYLDTQRQRLQALLRPWLELELARPEFSVRERELKLQDVTIGPLRLTVRVDRVDETAGGMLIVDYKTGAASPGDWSGERPDAPQLPLYAAIATADGAEQLGGLAFALLRAGDDLDLKGLAEGAGVLAKPVKLAFASLQEQVEDWRRVLTGLAEAFVQGDAVVDPKRYPTTCVFCAQRMLCRLNPAMLHGDIDDDAQENEHG